MPRLRGVHRRVSVMLTVLTSLSSGQQCVNLINLQAADLEARGRALLQRQSEACSQEVTSLSQGLAASEEDRLTLAGKREEQALRQAYAVSENTMFRIYDKKILSTKGSRSSCGGRGVC